MKDFSDDKGSIDYSESAYDSKSKIEITSMRIPVRGEQVTVINPQTNEELIVTFGKVYTSAGGTLCSAFTSGEEGEHTHTDGVACLNKSHDWTKNPLELKMFNAQ